MSEFEEDDDIQDDDELEGGAGVREPRVPKNPAGQSGAAAPIPELVSSWYY